MRIPIHFDMETQDPDDVLTLAILATHPRAELVGVSCTPGGPDQIGLVSHVLDRLGLLNIRVAGDPNRTRPCVSTFHDKWLGRFHVEARIEPAELLERSAQLGATLLTGGPLKNLSGVPPFPRWVAQGGFAGDSVVPHEHRLPKFVGKETCATFNFNGAPKVAEAMLASPMIQEKILVSKNVCHGVAWDRNFHNRVLALHRLTPGLQLTHEGMGLYLEDHPNGKLLHDPLALAVAIDPSVCEFRPVEMYRLRGEWGARLKPDSNVRISINVDHARFFEVLTEVA